MTTCPKCDTIRMDQRQQRTLSGKRVWHVNCECGWAWNESGDHISKALAKKRWELKVMAYERLSQHAAEVYASRQ